MALFLNEQEVVQLLPMNECIETLDEAFAHAGGGDTEIKPRSRIRMPGGFFHFMAAADSQHKVFGYKAYPSFGGPAGAKMIVMLYDYETGGLLACMEGSRMGQIRTGAASGLATRYMAREGANTVAVIGSGFQARTQLEAVAAVREIKEARVYSRRQERREEFRQEKQRASEPGSTAGGLGPGLRRRSRHRDSHYQRPRPGAGRRLAGAGRPRQRRGRQPLDAAGN